MTRDFNALRGEAAVIDLCFEFNRVISQVDITTLRTVRDTLKNTVVNNRHELPIKNAYIDYIEATIAMYVALDKLLN